MKTTEDYATEIVEQVHNGASVSDVMQLLEEYASQFKTVDPEKRAALLKEIVDTDQKHGMYEPQKPKCSNCGRERTIIAQCFYCE